MSATLPPQPQNEIFYLLVLLNGTTRFTQKSGIKPVVCYVDASTSTNMPEAKSEMPVLAKKNVDELQKLISQLTIMSEYIYTWFFFMVLT